MRRAHAVLALVLAGGTPTMLPAATGAGAHAMKPDFSTVTTIAAEKRAAAEGRLVKILLFPSELGGSRAAPNSVYVTPEAAQAKDMITQTLIRLFKEGTIDTLSVVPHYRGDCRVPSEIVMHATHTSGRGSFHPTIHVW